MKKQRKAQKKTSSTALRRTAVAAERVVTAASIESLIVYLKIGGSRPLRVLYRVFDQGFSVFVEDLCEAIDVDVSVEIARMKQRSLPLSQVGRVGPDGSMTFEHVFPLVDLRSWFDDVTSPPTVEGNRRLHQHRRDLYDGVWAALSHVPTQAGRLEWRALPVDDTAEGPLLSDEQIAADFGVPPEVVNQAAWHTGTDRKKGLGKSP